MKQIAYFESSIKDFLESDRDAILGVLAKQHCFVLEHQQKYAWQYQIEMLRDRLPPLLEGYIYFEFSVPRIGKRLDVALLIEGILFVVEFKVGADSFDRSAIEQVHDYALDPTSPLI